MRSRYINHNYVIKRSPLAHARASRMSLHTSSTNKLHNLRLRKKTYATLDGGDKMEHTWKFWRAGRPKINHSKMRGKFQTNQCLIFGFASRIATNACGVVLCASKCVSRNDRPRMPSRKTRVVRLYEQQCYVYVLFIHVSTKLYTVCILRAYFSFVGRWYFVCFIDFDVTVVVLMMPVPNVVGS